MDECWADDVAALDRALGRAHVATHATDAEQECDHGCLPTDSAVNRRKVDHGPKTTPGPCTCWDGYQMTKGQGEEFRAEVLSAISALSSGVTALGTTVEALERNQAALLMAIGALKETNGRVKA